MGYSTYTIAKTREEDGKTVPVKMPTYRQLQEIAGEDNFECVRFETYPEYYAVCNMGAAILRIEEGSGKEADHERKFQGTCFEY